MRMSFPYACLYANAKRQRNLIRQGDAKTQGGMRNLYTKRLLPLISEVSILLRDVE